MLVSIGLCTSGSVTATTALEHYTRALRMLKDLGNRPARRVDTGEARELLCEPRRISAGARHEPAGARCQPDGRRRAGEVRALLNLADVHRLLGRTDRALEGYEQALAAARRHGLKLDVARTLIRLGYAYLRSRRLRSRAVSVTRRLSPSFATAVLTAPGREAAALAGLGTTRRAAGDNAGSVQAFEEALAISRRIRDRGRRDWSLERSRPDAGRYRRLPEGHRSLCRSAPPGSRKSSCSRPKGSRCGI